MVEYIEPAQAIAVVEKLGLHVRDEGLLFSALARPAASMFGTDAYATIEQKAAALLSSLSQNHPLFDGNKRLSLVLTLIFLRLNGFELNFSDDDAFELVLSAAQGLVTVDELAHVIAAGIHAEP
ncbi:type II toxin-antitoxin system death-on-curing family toxin [Microbacterium sp. H1-D42]|uniref:type II toxin-antitoxin system death-on-curing family toxin n=1 Tax=Microbacterium sp. H1-D42 TaxID=2925844 RepID=UPI001F53A702|nr:type II toxin-antitoxin system death-on-curing family toxin [Microbacterium sp. H1-D42]UNK70983.1 type II toxin-antitoxin system death-on-curing family toxin [Microbacterium sp. H1-D42]